MISAAHDLHATAPRGPSVWTSLEQLAGLRLVEVHAWEWAVTAGGVALAVCTAILVTRLVLGGGTRA